MFGSSILDVAIGMAFIYLLLSLIASTIQEALSAIVQSRAANLEHGIRSLFSGGKLGDHYFVDLLYKHGLIRGLYQDPKMDKPDTNDPDAAASAPKRKSRPLLERLRKLLGIKPSEITDDISDPFLLPSYIPARTFAIAMMDILNPDKQNGKPALDNIEQKLFELCKPVEGKTINKATAEALCSLLADAKNATNSAEKFRANIENWYNDAMDRVSGWYKKYTQKILLIVGLILAIGFNVDSVRVAQTLWFDHDARQGIVNAANAYTTANKALPKNADQTDAKALAEQMRTTIQAFNETSSKYLMPVGWHHSWRDSMALPDPGSQIAVLFRIVEMLAGWFITALALSFGAPFWFDTLNKFMVVRSTVKPQEKSLNEASKS